jgi:hypothetical protein
MKRPVIFPEFLKKLDHYLLQHYPVLWASRLHFWGYVVVVSVLFVTILSLFIPIMGKDTFVKYFFSALVPFYIIMEDLEKWQSGLDVNILQRFSVQQLSRLWGIFIGISAICAFVIMLPYCVDNIKIRCFFNNREIQHFERLVSLEKYILKYQNYTEIEELDVVLDSKTIGNYFTTKNFKEQLKEFVKARRAGMTDMKIDSITYREYYRAADSLYRFYWPQTMSILSRSEEASDTTVLFRKRAMSDVQLAWLLNDKKVNRLILEGSKPVKIYSIPADDGDVIEADSRKTALERAEISEISTGALAGIIERYRAPFPITTFALIWLVFLYMPLAYVTKIFWGETSNWRYKEVLVNAFLVTAGVSVALIIAISLVFDHFFKGEPDKSFVITSGILWISYVALIMLNIKRLLVFRKRVLHRKQYYLPLLLLWLHIILSVVTIIRAYNFQDWATILWFVPLQSFIYLLLITHIKRLDALPRVS